MYYHLTTEIAEQHRYVLLQEARDARRAREATTARPEPADHLRPRYLVNFLLRRPAPTA